MKVKGLHFKEKNKKNISIKIGNKKCKIFRTNKKKQKLKI